MRHAPAEYFIGSNHNIMGTFEERPRMSCPESVWDCHKRDRAQEVFGCAVGLGYVRYSKLL